MASSARAKQPAIELVIWQDIASHYGGDWFPSELAKSLVPALCYSVGWVVHEDKEKLTIVGDRSTIGKHESYGHDTVIPKGVIVDRHPLKCPRAKLP